MHLNPDELVDLAEGVRLETAAPHLQACAACREQLAGLRAAMAAAIEVDVPEPSPLFWGHLSERVQGAVAAEESLGRHSWLGAWTTWRVRAWPASAVVGAVAAMALVAYLTLPRAPAPARSPTADAEQSAAGALWLQPFGSADDPSLALVADLTDGMDLEAATEAGLTNHVGDVDEVVASLSDSERTELQRLLKEALAKPGA